MSDKLLDILKEHPELNEQELMDYLMGHLTPQERHEIEQRLTESELFADAEEGLSQLKNKERIQSVVADLNKQLATQLQQRRRKKRKELPGQSLIILTTFIILALIVIAFLVIYKMQVK